MRWIIWAAVALPAFFWGALHLMHRQWWAENLSAMPGVFFGYFALMALLLFLFQHWLQAVVSSLAAVILWVLLPPAHNQVLADCHSPVSVAQISELSSSRELSSVIGTLADNQVDLLVLQSVPAQQPHWQELDRQYPYRYHVADLTSLEIRPASFHPTGPQKSATEQVLLSRVPLSRVTVQRLPSGMTIIQGVWHPFPQEPISFVVANPPFPDSEREWRKRNAALLAVQRLVAHSNQNEMMIVGDFNLASTSLLFINLFAGFETAPVSSWPNWWPDNQTPSFAMLSLDHFWLKALTSGRRICSRSSYPVTGGEHNLVLTRIGY
ncbi:endonuclease/exonuclease/phosphatase family protein [Vibrio sp.]|uniref:endonuclease/exonuclease/phosphatase family protein n=1 Tax=Vibrio sp. TaxID=678 RepID=UPI003D13AF44